MSFEKTAKQCEAIKVLNSGAKHVLLLGGSRSGKTFIILRNLIIRSLKTKSRHVILRKHFNHVKQAVWLDTLPRVLELCFEGLQARCRFDKSDYYMTLPNGSELWIGGLDDKERTEKILGKEYSTIFFNECSEITNESRNIALTRLSEKNKLKKKVYYDCNPPKRTHWTYQLFVERVDPVTMREVEEGDYQWIRLNPTDNTANIDESYIKDVLERLPPLLRERFLNGEFGSDGSDIFRGEWLIPSIPPKKEDTAAIFAFCDPAITEKELAKEDTCESGIVVLAVDYNGINHDIEVLHGMWEYQQLKRECKGVYERYKDYPYFYMGYEKVAFQKALGSDLADMGIPCDGVPPDTDKVRRAITVTDLLAEGKCRVNDLALRRQLLSFPTGKLKDLVDAYVYALRMVKIYADKYKRIKNKFEGMTSEQVWFKQTRDYAKKQESKKPNVEDFDELEDNELEAQVEPEKESLEDLDYY